MVKIGVLSNIFLVFFLFETLSTGLILEANRHPTDTKKIEVVGEAAERMTVRDSGVSTPSDATDWWLLWENDEGKWYADLSQIRYSPEGIVAIWLRCTVTERGKNQEIGRRRKMGLPFEDLKHWDYNMILFDIDCLNGMARLVENLSYDQDENQIEHPVGSLWTTAWQAGWHQISKRTPVWSLYSHLCR